MSSYPICDGVLSTVGGGYCTRYLGQALERRVQGRGVAFEDGPDSHGHVALICVTISLHWCFKAISLTRTCPFQ